MGLGLGFSHFVLSSSLLAQGGERLDMVRERRVSVVKVISFEL